MAREPIFNAPKAVVWILGLLALVHGALSTLSTRREAEIAALLAFNPARYSGSTPELLGGWPAGIWSFVTHQLVHGDLTHLLINGAWLLAFGGAVAQRIGSLRFVVFSTLCGISGALMFLVLRAGEDAPMVGASGAVSGLMGGAFRFFFTALDQGGLRDFRNDPGAIPLMSLRDMLRDRRVVLVVGIWVLVNFLTALAAPILTSASGIAWEAHLGGFLFGLLTFQAFDPPRSEPASRAPVRPTLH